MKIMDEPSNTTKTSSMSRTLPLIFLVIVCIIINWVFVLWVVDPDVDLILSTTDQFRIQHLLQNSRKDTQGVSEIKINADYITTKDPLSDIIPVSESDTYAQLSGGAVECVENNQKCLLNHNGLTKVIRGVSYGSVLYGTHKGLDIHLNV